MLKWQKGTKAMNVGGKSNTDYLKGNKRTNIKGYDTQNEATNVEKQPPMNPSQVFFGDNSINGVFPNDTPKIYAMISLVMTREHGKINQTIPFFIIKFTFKNIHNHNRALCHYQY